MNKRKYFGLSFLQIYGFFLFIICFLSIVFLKHFLTVLYVISSVVIVNSPSKSAIKDGALSLVLSKYTKNIASSCFIWQKPALFIFTPETEYSYVCAICSRNLIR